MDGYGWIKSDAISDVSFIHILAGYSGCPPIQMVSKVLTHSCITVHLLDPYIFVLLIQ